MPIAFSARSSNISAAERLASTAATLASVTGALVWAFTWACTWAFASPTKAPIAKAANS